jgi:methionyl-tRNA formyltransferase
VPTFEALLASRHVVAGLVCQPDRPRGRGHKVLAPPTKVLAESRDIPVFQPLRLKDEALMDALGALHADIGVVAAYGRILPDALIALPARGMINVHASLLPRYRGAAPIQRAVMAGDDVTGVTIMRVVRELDAGPMLAAKPIPIAPDATSVDVERELAVAGADLLVATLDKLAGGEAVPEIAQDDRLATHAPKIGRADGLIDWSRSAAAIHNLVRALHPWPHAYSYLQGERLLIHRTKADAKPGAKPDPVRFPRLGPRIGPANRGNLTGSGFPGSMLAAEHDRLDVMTGDGVLRILDIQPEGKRVMTAREWLAGRRDLKGRFTRDAS